MRKAILAGALGVLLGAGLLATQGANAYSGTGCSGANIAGPVYGPGGNEVVCVDGLGAPVDGGALIAGVTANNGPNRVCVGGTYVQVNSPVGAYLVIDGDNANMDPLDGYAGISNYETSSGNENCAQGNNGGGSNSGGSFGVDGQPATQLPLPLVCGNTSGDEFGNTGRDGCYNP
jgi:hypothetical protein